MTEKTVVEILQQTLTADRSDESWLRLLRVLMTVGVADSLQLQQATGFSRDKVERLIDKMEQAVAAQGAPPILRLPGKSLPRPGVRGRAPKVYLLGESGAALLRANGHPKAEVCGLQDDVPIIHALAVLDLHLAVTLAGLAVQTDRVLHYEGDRTIRPDCLVTLPDGSRAIFEVEQMASPDLLRRIKASLQNKADFFASEEGRRVLPAIRMLIHLPRGKEWDKTLKVWRQAIGLTAASQKRQPLPFRLLALPLGEFLQLPDWKANLDEQRWVDLTAASLFENAELASPSNQDTKAITATRAPKSLLQRSPHDDRLVLGALWQWFQENAHQQAHEFPRPDPEFLELVCIIYAASHDAMLSPLDQAAFPHASVYLLGQYLQMHPQLRKRLQAAMQRGVASMRWNSTTILHRLQIGINVFLAYHGWRSDGPLRAYPSVCDWNSDESRAFGVAVRIASRELLMREPNGVVPGRDQVRRAEQALAWVLWALFAYADRLGLQPPVFW